MYCSNIITVTRKLYNEFIMEAKSYRDTMIALNHVFGHYDLDMLKTFDTSQLEDLFMQDSFSNPVKHKTFDLNKDRINFKIIKQELTST